MKSKKTICPFCGKFNVPYLKNSDICQLCYRDLLSRYAYYFYKDEKIKPNENTKAYRICELMVVHNFNTIKICELLNVTLAYVNSVKRQYLYRGDSNGNQIVKYLKD